MKGYQNLILGILGGLMYVGVELLYRGRSHVSMFVAGGICFVAIGLLDTVAPGMPVLAQVVLGSGWITAVELLTGLLVNRELQIWDYSRCLWNFRGQICLQYSLLWIPLALAAIWADDWLRRLLFGTPMPVYRWI